MYPTINKNTSRFLEIDAGVVDFLEIRLDSARRQKFIREEEEEYTVTDDKKQDLLLRKV